MKIANLKIYFSLSVAAAAFLWFSAFFWQPNFLPHSFWQTLFLAGNLYVWSEWKLWMGRPANYFAALFIFQLVCVLETGLQFPLGNVVISYLFSLLLWNTGLILGYFPSVSGDGEAQRSKEHKDRLFFHDLINQTHGLNLYLQVKSKEALGLRHEELGPVLREIKTMQTLITDHYHLQHKNLYDMHEHVPFSQVQWALEHVLSVYLPSSKVTTRLQYNYNNHDGQEVWIHVATLHRIWSNLVKNIAESQSSAADFIFDLSSEGMTLTAKNKINHLKDHGVENISLELSQIILQGDAGHQMYKGLGLESVSQLCYEKGGSFNISIEGDWWIGKVFLPAIKVNRHFKSSEGQTALKKVA